MRKIVYPALALGILAAVGLTFWDDLQLKYRQWRFDHRLPVGSTVDVEGLVTPEGEPLSAAQLDGRVVVLDFWATWCLPCLEAFPAMDELARRYEESEDVVVLAVNIAERESPAEMERVIRESSYSFRFAIDPRQDLSRELTALAIPTTCVVDREGVLRFREVGPLEGFRERLESQVASLVTGAD